MREAEPLSMGSVEPVEALVLLIAQPIEPCRGLLGDRRGAHRSRARGPAREVGVRPQKRELHASRGLAGDLDHGVVQIVDARERTRGPGALGDPGRVLEHTPEGPGELGAVQVVQVGRQNVVTGASFNAILV
jgi:hypothetical protein